MLLRFSCATFLGLAAGSIVGTTDAFLAPTSVVGCRLTTSTVILRADNVEDGDEEVSSGSERFRAMKAAAEAAKQERVIQPRAIDNPFLTPPPPTPAQPVTDPSNLSVEEQAAMFREMMNAQQPPPASQAVNIPPTTRVAKTDRAGRPQGRNRDADQIANSSDVYFAQLKRDSTVRTLARIRGEDDTAEAVFEDDGIEELANLLQTNPYLKAQREEEAKLIDTVPDAVMPQYLEKPPEDPETLATPGIKWKDIMMKKKQRSKQETSSEQSEQPAEAIAAVPEPAVPAVQPTQPEPAAEVVQPEPEPAVVSTAEPAAEAQQQPPPSATAAASAARVLEATSSPDTPEETKQKVRTLMGLLLKHRGGPGFGKGRLKGPEIDRFENLLGEVTTSLRSEALSSTGGETATATAVPETPAPSSAVVAEAPASQEVAASAPVAPTVTAQQVAAPVQAAPVAAAPSVGGSDLSQVDGIILCIEGANTMFKNSPPELKPSVLISLRAALMAAVGTCNNILGDEMTLPASTTSVDMSQIDNCIVVIEGAIAMYKNSPAELKQSILVTLRAALVSAVKTCDAVSGQPAAAAVSAASPATPAVVPATQTAAPQQVVAKEQPAPAAVQAPPPATGTAAAAAADPNSKKLEGIYNSLEAAAGDGPLGLRSDLTSDEAGELESQLMEMRGILMSELDAGIPATESEAYQSEQTSSGSSAGSNYQQMLAKAKAEKAAAA